MTTERDGFTGGSMDTARTPPPDFSGKAIAAAAAVAIGVITLLVWCGGWWS